MVSLEFVTFLPCVAIMASMYMMRRGIWAWMSCILAGGSLAIAVVFLRMGVVQSCQIDESECLGAQATSYFVLALWMFMAVGFIVRFVVVHRSSR